ncbi:MAG: phosphoglycerate dehydrogenase [Crocinitomicaceae bacterium]|nr:phosphoglycerate dehydrogenase [Crocinitomicaceae bacterium]
MSIIQKVLIVDDVHQSLVFGLISNRFDVFYMPDIQANEIADFIVKENIEGLVIRSKLFLTEDFFAKCSSLIWVARGGAGMDNIDEDAAFRAGVKLMNSENANSDAVGEQTLAMLLALRTNLVKSHNEVSQGIWDREGNRGIELKGKTIGIIGYGNTGKAVCEKLSGFGVNILVYDKYKSKFSDTNLTEVNLDEILAKSDVISLHIPLNSETKNFVDEAFINQVSKPFILLNLSRGKIVDIQSVIKFLQSGKIVGFGADVLPNEPPNMNDDFDKKMLQSLNSFSNVLLTPHVGGWTIESYEKISEILLFNILNFNNINRA